MSDPSFAEERKSKIERRLAELRRQGADLPPDAAEHPWARVVGILKDHPDADEFEEEVRKYRETVNLETDAE